MFFTDQLRRQIRELPHYDFVASLHKADLAWEYLRRNYAYQRDWRNSAVGREKSLRLMDGTRLYRPRRRYLQAEEWGLINFRRSGTARQ